VGKFDPFDESSLEPDNFNNNIASTSINKRRICHTINKTKLDKQMTIQKLNRMKKNKKHTNIDVIQNTVVTTQNEEGDELDGLEIAQVMNVHQHKIPYFTPKQGRLALLEMKKLGDVENIQITTPLNELDGVTAGEFCLAYLLWIRPKSVSGNLEDCWKPNFYCSTF
jgi:hypothetical protein